MLTETPSKAVRGLTQDRVRATKPSRYALLPRVVAGVPLFGIGVAHVVVPEAAMRPLVEAAGVPFAAIVSPVAVAIQIVAGVSLLLGLWARLGGLLAIPSMVGALYAHLAIEVWPNGPETEPPLALPLSVMVGAAYVLWRGAGRWSLDWRFSTRAASGDSASW